MRNCVILSGFRVVCISHHSLYLYLLVCFLSFHTFFHHTLYIFLIIAILFSPSEFSIYIVWVQHYMHGRDSKYVCIGVLSIFHQKCGWIKESSFSSNQKYDFILYYVRDFALKCRVTQYFGESNLKFYL